LQQSVDRMFLESTILKSSQASGILAAMVVAFLDVRRRGLTWARASRISPLVYLDVIASSAAFGVACAKFAELLLIPRQNPAGILTVVAFATIFFYLWGEGRRSSQSQRPEGIVLGEFLILAGIAHLLALSIQAKSLLLDNTGIACSVLGAVFLGVMVPRFLVKKEEHHILTALERQGETLQPEYTPPTAECPHPERWTMQDSMSAELEILEFLKQLVLTLKPALIVETGTFVAASAIRMAEAVKQNGFGKIITCELDPLVYAKAKERIAASGLGQYVDCRNESSLTMAVEGTIDLFFSDSHLPIREEEIRKFLPQISPNGLILMHDTSSHYKIAREAAFRLEQEGLLSVVLLPTPRGLMIAQKRQGRK
jgi:predicted O-methyltransferase YrrM